MTPVQKATLQTIEGLLDIIPPGEHQGISYDSMRALLETAVKEIDVMPIDKISRWVGYAQGVLIAHGVLDVIEERNRTRPFFHEAYRETGLAIPPTREF